MHAELVQEIGVCRFFLVRATVVQDGGRSFQMQSIPERLQVPDGSGIVRRSPRRERVGTPVVGYDPEVIGVIFAVDGFVAYEIGAISAVLLELRF